MDYISPEQKETRVKDYFEKVIMGYLANDIRTLLNPQLDNIDPGGCSAPLAMTVFSGMNQIGYITSSNEKVAAPYRTTELCIKEFCKDWMKKVDGKYNKSTVQEIMVNFYRHGLAHQFLSIAFSAVTRDPKQNELLAVQPFDDGRRLYILQAKILAQDFLKAIDFVGRKIESAREKNPQFIHRIHQRLCDHETEQIDKNDFLFQKAGRNIPKDDNISAIKTAASTCTSAQPPQTSITIDPTTCGNVRKDGGK